MKKILIRSIFVLVFIILALSIYVWITLYPQFPVANGYAAKKMCSCVFIADRTQESVQTEDLSFGPLSLTQTKIDRQKMTATSSLFGLSHRKAVYRNDVGCILLDGQDDYHTDLKLGDQARTRRDSWIADSTEVKGVNYSILKKAVKSAFDHSYGMDTLKTRAVVVIYKDTLVFESYAKGFDKNTPILGWSMTKSIISTLIGIMVKNQKMDLTDIALFDEWKDGRQNISLSNMLQMQSGLAFEENYATLCDATKMLFMSENVSSIPISKPLEHEIGSVWSYSSGTSNLLSNYIAKTVNDKEAYLRFPYDSLLFRIGMTSAVMETDESGLYIGSSFMYATPRDWARFGTLYLNYGSWHGDQVIDSSWVDFVRTPAEHSGNIYGGHFWLNAGHSAYPDVPEDLFSCNGFQGQYVFITPSYDAVVVRMGLAEEPIFDVNQFLKNILMALEPVFEG